MKCCYKLRQVIEIQEKTETLDANGARSFTWSTKFKTRAEVRALRGSERFQSDRLENPVSYKMITRFKNVSHSDRVLYKGRIFNIIHIIDIDEMRRFLELHLDTGVAS